MLYLSVEQLLNIMTVVMVINPLCLIILYFTLRMVFNAKRD